MKAVRLVQPGQPLELHDGPIPLPGPRDVLVRVAAGGHLSLGRALSRRHCARDLTAHDVGS